MNLFESQINKLNLSPTAKNTIIELRKICLEATAEEKRQRQEMDAMAKTFRFGEQTNNDTEALNEIKAIIKKSYQEASDNFNTGSTRDLFMSIVNKYRPKFQDKFGENWAKMLDKEAENYAHKNAFQ